MPTRGVGVGSVANRPNAYSWRTVSPASQLLMRAAGLTAPLRALSTLVDYFDGDLGQWPTLTGSPTIVGGRARIPASPTAGIRTAALFTLEDSSVALRLYANTGGTTTITVGPDTSNTVTLTVNTTTNTLSLNTRTAAVDGTPSSLTYSSTSHAWLRLREQDGTVYADTSADGSSWAQQLTAATPAWLVGVAAYLDITTTHTTGYAEVDYVGGPRIVYADADPLVIDSYGWSEPGVGTPGATPTTLTGGRDGTSTGGVAFATDGQSIRFRTGNTGNYDGANKTSRFLDATPQADAELYLEFQYLASADCALSIALRDADASGDGGTAYAVNFDPASDVVNVSRGVNYAYVDLLPSATFAMTSNVWYALRFAVAGSAVRAKWWQAGQAEPAAWGYEGTDTAIPAAGLGASIAARAGGTATARDILVRAVSYRWGPWATSTVGAGPTLGDAELTTTPTTAGAAGPVSKPATTSILTTNPATASGGYVTDLGTAAGVTAAPAVAAAGAVVRDGQALDVSVNPAVAAAASTTGTNVGSVTTTPTTAGAAGPVSKPATAAGATSSPAAAAAAGGTSKPASSTTLGVAPAVTAASSKATSGAAPAADVTPTVAASPGAMTRSASSSLAVSPAPAAAAGAIAKTAGSGGASSAPTVTAGGYVTDLGDAQLVAEPTPAADATLVHLVAASLTVAPTTAGTGTVGVPPKSGDAALTVAPAVTAGGYVTDVGTAAAASSPTTTGTAGKATSGAAAGPTVTPAVTASGSQTIAAAAALAVVPATSSSSSRTALAGSALAVGAVAVTSSSTQLYAAAAALDVGPSTSALGGRVLFGDAVVGLAVVVTSSGARGVPAAAALAVTAATAAAGGLVRVGAATLALSVAPAAAATRVTAGSSSCAIAVVVVGSGRAYVPDTVRPDTGTTYDPGGVTTRPTGTTSRPTATTPRPRVGSTTA